MLPKNLKKEKEQVFQCIWSNVCALQVGKLGPSSFREFVAVLGLELEVV